MVDPRTEAPVRGYRLGFFLPPDPDPAQQAVRAGGRACEEEQETAAAPAPEHGRARRRAGAPADSLREGKWAPGLPTKHAPQKGGRITQKLPLLLRFC